MNKINKLVVVLSLSLAFSSATFARIGETEEECGKLYGDVMVRQDEGGGIVKIAFAQGDMVVVARFLEGKAVSLNLTKFNERNEEIPFTTEELDGLLGVYGSRQDWKTVFEQKIKGQLLINASHNLVANVPENRKWLRIMSKAFFEAGMNEGRDKPIKLPEGVW